MKHPKLGELAHELRTCFRYDPPRGYREGRRRVSRMVKHFCECSNERAADIVGRLEQRGYMYAHARSEEPRWRFAPDPIDGG